MAGVRARCVGSGVPEDWFEHGHYLLAGTEEHIFPRWRDGRYVSSYSRRTRCYRCDSTRRYWLRNTDATAKAVKTHRAHAQKMVRKGQSPDIDTAVRMMSESGLTIAVLAQSALGAIGQPCPGRCFNGAIRNGRPACDDHVISTWDDLTLDWRDPRYPLSPENFGWLCMTCNRQKHEKPWAQFMARQHAIRQNFLHAERLPFAESLF